VASLSSPSKGMKGKEVERIFTQDSHQTIDTDVPFLIHPIMESSAAYTSQDPQPDNFSPPSLANIALVTNLATSTSARTEPTCKHSDRRNERPGRSGSRSPLADLPIFSFSPVDWSTVQAPTSPRQLSRGLHVTQRFLRP